MQNLMSQWVKNQHYHYLISLVLGGVSRSLHGVGAPSVDPSPCDTRRLPTAFDGRDWETETNVLFRRSLLFRRRNRPSATPSSAFRPGSSRSLPPRGGCYRCCTFFRTESSGIPLLTGGKGDQWQSLFFGGNSFLGFVSQTFFGSQLSRSWPFSDQVFLPFDTPRPSASTAAGPSFACQTENGTDFLRVGHLHPLPSSALNIFKASSTSFTNLTVGRSSWVFSTFLGRPVDHRPGLISGQAAYRRKDPF